MVGKWVKLRFLVPFSWYFSVPCDVIFPSIPVRVTVRVRVTVKVLGFGLRLGSWLELG